MFSLNALCALVPVGGIVVSGLLFHHGRHV
jgi:hypothetical protein